MAIRIEPCPRRVRARQGGVTVVDSERVLLVVPPDMLAMYYIPIDDLTGVTLLPSETPARPSRLGPVRFWGLSVGDRVVPDAAWSHPSPSAAGAPLAGYVGVRWDALETWLEEDEEVFVHPRDPYHRVDVLRSSRHVTVVLDGETLAESHRPSLLFETGLPTRYYLPPADVRLDRLVPSDTRTQCPYKGVASYWAGPAGGDIAWSYRYPIPECPKVEGLVAFFNERVDLWVDGALLPRPTTPWS